MKRQSKELISAILTVGSFIGMILAFIVAGGSWSVTAAVVVLVLVVVLVASMVALVSFSKIGWKVVGSKNEWDAAIAISPSKTAFWNRDYKEQVGKDDKRDERTDDEYYRRRSE